MFLSPMIQCFFVKPSIKSFFKLKAWLAILLVTLCLPLTSLANSVDNKKLSAQAETFQKGLDAAHNGQLDSALTTWEDLNKSGDLIPELKRALENNIAVILIKQKKYAEAKKRLDEALQADAQVSTTLANLNQLYAYDAQQAYQRIFKETPVNSPQGKWLYFDIKQAHLPTNNVIIDAENAGAVRVVKNRLEQWRQAWSAQDVAGYLSFYDEKAFIPKDGMSFNTWKKSRYRSLQKPKFIKVFLDKIQITPISSTMVRTRVYQRYHSDRFKDDVYKVLLWQKYDGEWKIVQEVVMYNGH